MPKKNALPDYLAETEPKEWDVILRTSTPAEWDAERVKDLFMTIVHGHAVVMKVKIRVKKRESRRSH